MPVLRAKLLLAARIGEIVDLRWKDGDLERKLVIVRQPKISKREPRSKVLPIAPELDAILRAQVRGFGETFVFTRYDVKPWRVADLQTAFERMLRASKLEPAHGRVTPHSIRHTAATWAANAGFAVRAPALLGHSAKGTTDDYIHAQDLVPVTSALAALESAAVAGAQVVLNSAAAAPSAAPAAS